MKSLHPQLIVILVAAATLRCALAQDAIPLVNIKRVDPTILIELRYAGKQNIAGRSLYPPGTLALTRPEVAQRLMFLAARAHPEAD